MRNPRMNSKTRAFVLIVTVVLVGGLWVGSSSYSGIKDCGQDGVCFREALKNCERAKVITDHYTIPWLLPEGTEEQKEYGIIRISAYLQTYAEIKKGNAEECTVYLDVGLKNPSLLERLMLFFRIDDFIESETGDMACTASTDEFFGEHFQYKVFDYCKGQLLKGVDRDVLEYEENMALIGEELTKIEDAVGRQTTEGIIFTEIIMPDIFSEVIYRENGFFEYKTKHPTAVSVFVARIGPLPIEEGTYKLGLRRSGNLTEVVSVEKIN